MPLQRIIPSCTLSRGACPGLVNLPSLPVPSSEPNDFSTPIAKPYLMFTRIPVPVASVTLDSFLRIGCRTTSRRPPHLCFPTTTSSSAHRPDMSHNAAGSDANAHRPKKLICTCNVLPRPRQHIQIPPRGTGYKATTLQSYLLTSIPSQSRPRRH